VMLQINQIIKTIHRNKKDYQVRDKYNMEVVLLD
jgi:hypothetical protein